MQNKVPHPKALSASGSFFMDNDVSYLRDTYKCSQWIVKVTIPQVIPSPMRRMCSFPQAPGNIRSIHTHHDQDEVFKLANV